MITFRMFCRLLFHVQLFAIAPLPEITSRPSRYSVQLRLSPLSPQVPESITVVPVSLP